jgi:hypothetical protein
VAHQDRVEQLLKEIGDDQAGRPVEPVPDSTEPDEH